VSEHREFQAKNLDGPVRITVPASVAYDLGALQQGIAALVDRLGCRACFSGADCTFHLERDFIINEVRELKSNPLLATVPDTAPALKGRTVFAKIAPEVSYNLDRVQEAVARVAGLLGCSPCHSGFDIAFLHELEVINIDRNLDVRGLSKSS
jgi:hypothetical protein